MPDVPLSSPILQLDSSIPKKELAKIRDNFSAVVLHDGHLWLGGDEGTSIDRMTRNADGNFGSHTRFDLAPLLKLPGDGGEIDIEGLDIDGGYLWLIGSHSLKRKKAEPDKTGPENIKRLANISIDRNRFTLARVPLDSSGTPVDKQGDLTVARLQGDARGNVLAEALENDDHIGPFVRRFLPDGKVEGVPSKDNGLDVEGLAVSGNRVFLGLRGPVLRGWTVVIELQVTNGSTACSCWTFWAHPTSHSDDTSCSSRALASAISSFTERISSCSRVRRWTSMGPCSSTAGSTPWSKARTH